MLVLTGCTATGITPPPDPPNRTAPSAYLEPSTEIVVLQMAVQPAEVISDTTFVVTNRSTEMITLVSVEPVFDSSDGAIEVVATKIIRARRPDDDIGVQRTYPPVVSSGSTIEDAAGARIEPAKDGAYLAVLLLALRLSRGMKTLTAVRITFDTGGGRRTEELRRLLTLCANLPPGATKCEGP